MISIDKQRITGHGKYFNATVLLRNGNFYGEVDLGDKVLFVCRMNDHRNGMIQKDGYWRTIYVFNGTMAELERQVELTKDIVSEIMSEAQKNLRGSHE